MTCSKAFSVWMLMDLTGMGQERLTFGDIYDRLFKAD